jgi:hypothetical protein
MIKPNNPINSNIRKVIPAVIHSGLNTHHQDQVILPVSFKTTKIIVNIEVIGRE